MRKYYIYNINSTHIYLWIGGLLRLSSDGRGLSSITIAEKQLFGPLVGWSPAVSVGAEHGCAWSLQPYGGRADIVYLRSVIHVTHRHWSVCVPKLHHSWVTWLHHLSGCE